MATDVNILEDASAMLTEQEGRSNECAPAGYAGNQTVTKPAEIKDVETGSDKIEVISDFNVEEQDHDRAHEAMKISKLSCAEETKDKIHEAETSTDISSFDQHFEVITNEHAKLEVISESVEKEIITSDKDEISRSKEDKDFNLEECREQATSILEVNLGAENEALLPNLDLETKNQGEDDVRVVDSCIKDEDIDNRCSNNSIHVEVKGKDIESFRSSNKLESELKHDKTEDASINVAETPYIHHGEEATPGAASNNEDDNNNKLENQPSDLATEGVSTLGVALESGESIDKTSSEACAEIKKNILDSKWQVIDVPPVDEINEAEDSALLNSNGRGENGEDISQIGLTEINEDRKINPERDDGDQRGSWQQNEQQEKLGGDFILIPEKSEISAAGENVEMSTGRLHSGEKFEEKEEKEEPASTPNGEEALSSTEKNLPVVESITESEVKTEPQEENQESSKPHADIEEETEFQSEAQSKDIVSNDNSSEGAATKEIILQSNQAIEEHGNVLESLHSDEKIEIKNGGKIIPDKAKEREEDTDIQTQKTSTESVSEDEAPIRDRTIEQSFQEESPRESGPALIDDEHHRPENEETINVLPVNEKKSQNLREGTSVEVEEENNVSNLPPEFSETVNELERDSTVAVPKHVEVVTSMNNENAVPEEMELAERTEEGSEAVVEREGEEETTATLEGISQKENIEETVKATDDTKENEAENQEVQVVEITVQVVEITESRQATTETVLEVCERPKTDASESKTEGKEIDNTVESGTLPSEPMGIEKGENASCETKIEEEVEATITNTSDDLSVNNSEAASLEDVNEKPALKEVKSLNEEQPEASDASPDMKDFTTIKTRANGLGSVELDEREEQETNTEAKRDVEVLEVADEGGQQISHDITDQALTTSTPLSEVQLDQTFVDSDMVPSKEDPQTIEVSKPTDKTVAGDDASYVQAETPFIAHFEVSTDNKKENVDEETDQKNTVEYQPMTQRDKEQVIVLADHSEINKLETAEDEKSTVEVSKHIEVDTSANSENVALEGEVLAERTEDSSAVFTVERVGQEETTATLEGISQKENVEDKVKAVYDTKENEAANQETFNELQHERNNDSISSASNQNVESPDEVLDISLKKQEESVLGEFKDDDADGDKDAKIELIHEEYSMKTLHNDEKEKVEEFADVTTEGSKADASGDTEFTAEEETTTTHEEISQKEEKEEKIKPIDDDTKDNESENQEEQVFVTTEESQATAENILEVCEKSKIDASESKLEDRETENAVGSGTLSSVSVDTHKGREFREENESGDTRIKEEVEETSLTETKVTDTSDDFSEPKEDNDPLTTEENNNKLAEISTSTLGVSEKYEYGTNDSETAVLGDVSEKPATKEDRSVNEEKPEISDASPDMTDLTTVETIANSLSSVNIDEVKEKETDTEEKRAMEVPVIGDEGGEQISHDITDQALTTGTPLLQVQLEQTFVDSDIVLSKDDPETIETSKTTDKTIAGDDVSYIDADTAFIAHVNVSSDNKKDNADEEIDEKNTVEDQPLEQTEREQVIVFADQNEANELEIDKDEKSTVEVSKHVEVVSSMNSESAVLEEEELAERTEDSSAVVVVEREGQEETTATLERISQKANIEEKVTATDDTKENEAASQEVEVTKAESEDQTEATNLMDRNISNTSDDIPEPKEDHGASTIEQNNHNLVENSSSISEVFEKDDNSTNGSESETVRVVSENTAIEEGNTEYEEQLKGSDAAAPAKKDVTTIETKSISSSIFNNDQRQEEESISENVPEVVEEVIGHEARKLEVCEDKKPTVEVSKYTEVSTGVNNESALLEEEELSERTDESPAPAVIGEENEAAEPKVGSPSSEEEPAITKNSELLIEKSLHSDESERGELAEDKDKEATIKLKDNFTNVNDGEEKVEDFPDMNCEGSKEETKITVEKISQIEEIEEKEVRFIDDTKETEAANQEIPVTDTAGLAPGENNLKVCETSTTEALVSKPQEEIENIIGTLPSASVGTEAGNEYPHVHTDDTKFQQEVEVTYVESTEQIEPTSLIERKTSNPLDNYLEPKEDHGSLTTEENNNNLVDNASPTAGVLEKNESNITDSETEFLGITSDKTTMKGEKLVHEDQSECSDAVTQTRNVTCSNVSDERQEEETNSEENRNMEVLEASDEGLVSHDIEEKFEITGTDHGKESTISKPQSDEQLAPTDMNSSMVPSKEEPETIESSKTTKDTPARDDKRERTDGGDQKDKDQPDHMSPDLKTKNDISDTEDMEQLKREQVSGLEDQNGAHEVGIVKDEKSVGEVLKLIEDATSIKGEETVLEEGEHTERTEDGPAASGVEENPADLKEGRPISEEDAAPDMKDITATETKADCSSSVNNDERQEEESNLEENQNINVPEVVEEGISRETDLTISTPLSDDQLVHTFIDSSKNDPVPIENSDEGVYQKHKVVDETLLHELKTVDNISGTDATEQQEEEQVVAVSSDQNEACKLEFCKDETPTVEVSKHIEASTSRNDENTLLEEEDLAERTDKGPEVTGVEDEAAEQQAGSPGSEEPAITKSSELLNEKSLSSDEPDRSGLAEDKEKDAEINLKREEYSQQMPQKNGEEKVEEFADMNYDSSKADATTEYSERTTYSSEEETKITVEKISQEEETEEKIRSIDDTKETEAAKHEIPVTDGASQATGENNLKVSETLNTDASISKPQEEEIENIVGTFSSVSVGIQAEKEHPQAHADETKLKQEVEVKYAESTEKIEATLDNSSEPKEDHDALTMEENNNNLVDNDSPTTGVFEKDESNINDSETQFLGVMGDKTIMKDDKPVNEDQLEGSDVATQTKDVTNTEGEEEEINSEANKTNEVPEVADEGLQQESHQIEEKAENPSLDHKKESTISTPQSDEQLVQTNVESSIVPSKGEPETTEPSKTAEDTPERDEEKEGEDGRDQKHKDQEKHMPLDLKTENDILDTEDKELLKREQVSGLEDQNEASELEIVKDEKSSVEVSKDIEVVTCITSKNVVLEEEEIAARTEVNSAVAGAEREAAELKERTPSSEEEPAGTKSRELLVEEIYVTDGASQVTGENNLKVSDTSNTEASGKEYPQVLTDETKLPQKVEVTYAESSKEQIEAASLLERKFSSTLDNISELKEDHGDLTTEENNSNLSDNASPTARVFEKDESNITDSETEFLSIMSDKTILKDDKPVNEDGCDAATQTKDVTAIETKNSSCISDKRQEEETNSEEIKSMEVPEVADEGLQQVSHHIEDKAEITGLDHEKESTTSTPWLDEQLVQTEIDSNLVPSKDGPETIESIKTTEKSTVEVSKDIEVVTSTNDKTIVVEEEELAKRTEGDSTVAGVMREVAELKEGTPSSEEEPAKTKSSELQVEKIDVIDGASQVTGENNLKASETSNTGASVSKPQEEEIKNIVVTSPSASVGIEARKEYPQVHTDETKLPQKVEVTYAESSKEQIEATSLIERKFSSTSDNISELKEDHGDLTTEENNNNLVDNTSPTAEVFEKDESNITDSDTEFLSITSDKTILKDDKPVNEDQLEGSDAATQTKDVTTIETKNSSCMSDERQEEETNLEENKSMEVPEVADEGLQQVSHHIEDKAEITGLDHEKESTTSTPWLDEQLVQTEIDSNLVPSKDGPETIESIKTTEKSTVEVSKDIEVVTSTNDKTIVVEEEELAKRTEGDSTVAGVMREVAELKKGTPSSEEEPAKTKSSELQMEKVQVAYEELKEQNEATFLTERKISNTLDELSEPKEDHFALTTEENNADLVDNSTSGVSEKDESNTNESSMVLSKEEAETIESSKATEDTPARDEEKEREDGRDQKHKDQDGHMPSDLKTENDILDREDIEQLKGEQVSGLEDQNESSELEIVKDEMPSAEVSKDIEVATCINSNNVVLEEEEIAARTEDSSAVTGVEREVAEVKEGTPSSEEEPTESKTSELLAEKVEITYEDNKPVNEDQVEVCDAATNLKNVTNIETEANSSIVYNDERQGEETNSEENRNTEVLEAKDDGGQKMSHEIKEKDVITCTDHEKESTISTALLDEQLVQTCTDSSLVPSKEDQELIGSSKTTEEFAARDEKSTSFEISEGASTLANSDNEKEKADGGDQKHKDQDQLVSPHQKSQNDISDAEDIKQWKTQQVSGLPDQNETRELEIVKDEKSVEVLKQIEDIKCIKGEETVLKEEQHTERNEDSPAVIRVEEEPAELKGGSPINEEEPTITKNSELLLEKVHHTVEATDNGSIKEELTKRSIITAEEEGIEVKVLDSELKQHTKATELTEEKESVTLEDRTKQNINIIDISSLTSTDVLETGNKDSSSTSMVYERETAAEVLKKDEPIVDDDAKHVSVTVAIEETGLKNVVPEHEEQYKGSDFATEKESVTTILTQTTILNDKDIHERQEENFSMEKKGILEEADESHLKTDIHHVEETDKSTSVQNEGEGTTSSVLNFEDYPQQSLEEKDNYAPEITDKAEETHVPEHTTENKLLHKELEVAKQEGVYEVETEKSNGNENILEQTPEPESNATETDAVSALDNTLTEVTARNSESIKQIENLKNFAKVNEDVSSLTTIEALEEETCGEESKQTLSRDSENEKQKADGEYQKDKTQDELMPSDLKSANVIWGTEDIEQWKREQVSGLANQIEACELEPVKVEMSTVEVPKDAEVVTSMNGKDMLEEQDLAERAEENLAVVGVEREVAELKEGTLSCEDEPVKTKSSELLTEKVEVTYEESKKHKGALDDLPEPKEDHGALTTKEKNDNLVDNSSPSVEVLEKDENSTNDSDSATIEDDKPINKDQVEVSDAATETKDVTTIETEAHSSSVDNDERQEEATANSKEDQGSIGSSKTTEETAARDDSSDVNTKTASFEITEGDSILENSDNEKEIADGGDQKRKDQDQHMSPDPKSENDILDTEDTEQLKTQQVSGLADQNETCELEIVRDEKSVDEVSKHIEDGTCIKGEETVLEKDKHIGRTEDSPAVIGVEGESSELKEGSPISEEEPANTKNSELLVEKVHHMVETADNGNIKEEFMERSITSSEEEGGIEVRVSKSELKQHIEAMELTEEKESLALEDHTEASETCIVESSSITKVYEREAEAEVLKKDEPTTDDDTKDASMTVAIEETGSKDVAPELEEQDKGSDFATENESVTTITTESAVLNDKDIHERQEEDSSTEKKGIPEEDDCRLKTDYCVEETEKTSTMQHEREVTTSSVLDSQDYPQQSLEEKGIYVTEEITDKAAETYLSEHTTENKLLLHEREVAKQEGVFEVETEKSNASENILEQTTERESKVTESDVVSSADKIVNEVTATNSESIKQIESLENFSKVNEDVGSFNTAEASQEETHQEESKKTLFRTSSLESREAVKDTKGEIIKKDDARNISETLPRTLVGEDTGLNETLGENNKQENNFPPATEARDVTSTDTVNSRLDTINTDAIQEKSSCSEKNGEKQSPEIADEAVQEMHEDIRDKAPPKTVEHEEDSSFTTVPHDNLQCSLVTQAEEGSSANAESPFVVHTMEEKLTESNPDVIKEQIVDSEVRLMELQISSSTRDKVEDSNLSSTETLKVEESNTQTVTVESSIKEDHPTTKGAESAIKALQEDIQNESSRRPTEVPIVALQVLEQKMEKDIEVEEDNCPIMTNTPPVEVLRVESGPKEAQLDKALKRSDLDDQCPETIKSLQAEEVIGVKNETASSSLIAQLPPKVHENVDACEQNLAAENTDVGQGEDFLRTYEIVSKDEIIDDELLQTGDDEKINEEKEGGKFFPQDFLSKTRQENEREEVDPFKKTKETFQTLNNDNKHEVKSEALEVIQDKLPCDVEGKNIAEGSLGKADVESDHQQNRKTNENVLEVPQNPNEETTLEVSPENAEPGRAIGIGIILEGEKVGEEKIRHLGGVLTKKSTSIDAEKTSNISEKTIEEPLEAPKHLDEATDKAVNTEKEKTQEEEIPHVKDDKIEVISGATEIVESSKDVDIKVAHKKHHNILSGVGSKVKHSISKVKKAITCKSSHSKSSPK